MVRLIGKIFALFGVARLGARTSILPGTLIFIAALAPSATPPAAPFVAAAPARVIAIGLAARATIVLAA